MENIAVVTGADRGLGLGITKRLLEKEWRVFAGQFLFNWNELDELQKQYSDQLSLVPLDVGSNRSVLTAAQTISMQVESLGLLISNAGVGSPTTLRALGENQDFDEMQHMFNTNALGAVRMVEAFLPLLEAGERKRLCFVSSEAGSIERSERTAWFGYCMSKAALNMAVKNMFNDLRPKGFTFRLYHPGWVRSYMRGIKSNKGDMEPDEAAYPAVDYFLSDMEPAEEDRLVLRDYRLNEWPW